MAAEKHSSTRRRVLGAAVALPVLALAGLPAPAVIARSEATRQSSREHEIWNRRLTRYRRLHAHWKAEAETGAFRTANDEYNRARVELSTRFGSWEKARKSRIGKPLCRAAFARIDAAEDAYYDLCTAPMQKAATRLIRTPAPDLRALLAKIEIILRHEIESFDDTAPHPWDALRKDCRMLARTETGAR